MPAITGRPSYASSAERPAADPSSSSSFWVPRATAMPPFERSIVASTMFIAGDPMNPPTKMLTGRS